MVLLLALAFLTDVHAAAPDGIRAVLAPTDAPAQYRAYLEKAGKPKDELACGPIWPERALLCFRVWEGERRRWVTQADLGRWEVDPDSLRQQVTVAAEDFLTRELVAMPVGGMEETYLMVTDGDGRAALAVLAPELLAARLGVPFLAAMPSEGVFMAWKGGNAELDHVMAVGVREMYDSQSGAVTPFVHAWDGKQWTSFAQASPKAK